MIATALTSSGYELSKEYQIKAAFLYNFTKFVEWPPSRFADKQAPIVIGVVSSDAFRSELEEIVRSRNANGRPIRVRAVSGPADLPALHMLFIAADAEPRVEMILAAMPVTGLLVVGDSPRMAVRESMITFVISDQRVRFVIDAQAAERRGLKISAQLLRLATTVRL